MITIIETNGEALKKLNINKKYMEGIS